jgi:hypothetical protein
MSIATEQQHLIEPHGGKLVDRTGGRPEGVKQLEQLALTSRELSDLDMLASGALSPLEGFMAQHDYESVVDTEAHDPEQCAGMILAKLEQLELVPIEVAA